MGEISIQVQLQQLWEPVHRSERLAHRVTVETPYA
jgi:hypothetical protein